MNCVLGGGRVCVSDIERNQTYGENVCVCDGKLHAKQGIHEEIVRAG